MIVALRRSPCVLALALVLALAGCSAAVPSARQTAITPTRQPSPAAATATLGPIRYSARVLLRGGAQPDDLTFDRQGRLLFSDFYAGTISRLEQDGTFTVLLRNLAGPEGIVVLPDGTLLIAEQRANRIVSVAPGATTPRVVRVLPGTPTGPPCKDGVDNIALDPTSGAIIVPDSPTGAVYRMSADGQSLTPLASDIARPVGAVADAQGDVYVADECGGAVWKITPSGQKTRIGGFAKPDDVAFDPRGNLLVLDLGIGVHALIRVSMATGQRETLARDGFAEPQGLAVDANGDLFVSDDASDLIVEYIPS